MTISAPDCSPANLAASVSRFAPSPSGLLHLGHAYSAMVAWNTARDLGGHMLLRIEDIDSTRCRPEFELAIFEDLEWLGLTWNEPVIRQSDRLDQYGHALASLHRLGVTYPCFCTRRQIQQELSTLRSAPHQQTPSYAGTCRELGSAERQNKIDAGIPHSIRLHLDTALALMPQELSWVETDGLSYLAKDTPIGDEILARKDIGTSYHIAVVVDDASQGVDLVVRGEDLRNSTGIHRILQELLGLPQPCYLHHKLITDSENRRLAKRDGARAIRKLREEDRVSPGDVWRSLGFQPPETL